MCCIAHNHVSKYTTASRRTAQRGSREREAQSFKRFFPRGRGGGGAREDSLRGESGSGAAQEISPSPLSSSIDISSAISSGLSPPILVVTRFAYTEGCRAASSADTERDTHIDTHSAWSRPRIISLARSVALSLLGTERLQRALSSPPSPRAQGAGQLSVCLPPYSCAFCATSLCVTLRQPFRLPPSKPHFHTSVPPSARGTSSHRRQRSPVRNGPIRGNSAALARPCSLCLSVLPSHFPQSFSLPSHFPQSFSHPSHFPQSFSLTPHPVIFPSVISQSNDWGGEGMSDKITGNPP